MFGCCSLAAERISRRNRSSTPGAFDQVPADDLEHLQPPHQLVLGEVDDAHPAPAQLADDLVVGVVGQLGREGRRAAARRGRRRRFADGRRRSAVGPWASRSRPRKLSPDSPPTRRRHSGTTSRCSVDRRRPKVVELAQAVGVQGLVGRVQGGGGVHDGSSGPGSVRAVGVTVDGRG